MKQYATPSGVQTLRMEIEAPYLRTLFTQPQNIIVAQGEKTIIVPTVIAMVFDKGTRTFSPSLHLRLRVGTNIYGNDFSLDGTASAVGILCTAQDFRGDLVVEGWHNQPLQIFADADCAGGDDSRLMLDLNFMVLTLREVPAAAVPTRVSHSEDKHRKHGKVNW